MAILSRRAALPGLVILAACGSSPPPAAEPPHESRPPTEATDVQKMILDAAAKDACSKLRGKFIGLPGEESGSPAPDPSAPPDPGLVPVAGRWRVRACDRGVEGTSLRLAFGGIGWQWVDRMTSGFHVQQYVFFNANVELRGALDVGYDARARVASIWMTPTADP